MVELLWDGKYDAQGRRVAPLRVKLPFQTVETVNESAQERQLALDLFSRGRATDWRNRLMWGDKKYVLPALLDEFAGKVDLIYIDPPFATGADFSFRAQVPHDPETPEAATTVFVKDPSIIEVKAYRDTWGRGLDSYLSWFYDTVVFLRELMAEHGSLYVHLDWHVGHYAKVILDDVFGQANFVNQIIWKRQTAHSDYRQGAKHFGRLHDMILLYAKAANFVLKPTYRPYDDSYVLSHYSLIEEGTGRRYQLGDLTGPGGQSKGNPYYEVMGFAGYWRYSEERMAELIAAGRVVQPGPGSRPRMKRYLDEMPGLPVQDVWDDINPINSQAREALGYETQKPEVLLERIIQASSNEGDLILDCFCGSGTTAAVAEKLGRRWLTCDLGRFAIHTTRKRLLSIENVRPFVVQNLGKYERQAWQAAEFGGPERAAEVQAGYRRFILDLYGARPIEGYAWLHGVRQGRLVHVGAVDSPISPGDVQQIALEFRKATGTGKDAPGGSGVDVLGWDFAFELNEVARQQAQQANVAVRFVRIPREVLEKRAVEQGDIRFFELAALAVDVATRGRNVTLTLTDFAIPPDDVPAEVQGAISHWSQWIDYWAVDWDNRGDTFHNEWQTYRTRKDKKLGQHAAHRYDAPGEYRIMVKVIDILGNDTTKTLQVTVV